MAWRIILAAAGLIPFGIAFVVTTQFIPFVALLLSSASLIGTFVVHDWIEHDFEFPDRFFAALLVNGFNAVLLSGLHKALKGGQLTDGGVALTVIVFVLLIGVQGAANFKTAISD